MGAAVSSVAQAGLSLAPFRAARYTADGDALSALLSPPYDVIDAAARDRLLALSPDNAVGLILPRDPQGSTDYARAARMLDDQIARGVLAVDDLPALYVYEIADPSGTRTRGLLGAVELHAPEDGVILPHEDVMAGPVADRLALMEATEANLEPIYLIYDGNGDASAIAAESTRGRPVSSTTTSDGIRHTVWAIRDPAALAGIDADLRTRTAVIADGHHRYATYLELRSRRRAAAGTGPWDRGLAMLVDTATFGPRVDAIHRVVPRFRLQEALAGCAGMPMSPLPTAELPAAIELLATAPAGFAAILTDGEAAALIGPPSETLLERVLGPSPRGPVERLDTTIAHRILVAACWGRPDTVDALLYAHDAAEAVSLATKTAGIAILLRPTPIDALLDVAHRGLRMPRKSTLFTPKPASGIAIRRFADSSPI